MDDKEIVAAILTLGILPKVPPAQSNRDAAALEAVRCFYAVNNWLDQPKTEVMKPPTAKPRQ
jgi:hypothetical protein